MRRHSKTRRHGIHRKVRADREGAQAAGSGAKRTDPNETGAMRSVLGQLLETEQTLQQIAKRLLRA